MSSNNKWLRSFSTGGRNIQLGRHRLNDDEPNQAVARDGQTRKGRIWETIWRKFSNKNKSDKSKSKNKNKGIFEFSRSVHVQIPRYDEHSYAQNFDKGTNWDEPEQLLKSFSVRYADRSRIYHNFDLN